MVVMCIKMAFFFFLLLAIPAAGKAVTFSRNMKIATFHRQRSTPPLRRDSRLSIAAYFFFRGQNSSSAATYDFFFKSPLLFET